MVKVLIVDDQHLMREGLATILQLDANMDVIGTARNGREAYEAVKQYRPDVVLMDIRMPVVDGVEGTRLIKEEFPDTKVLILTTFNDNEFILQALDNGASGYILKEMPSEMIISAISAVYAGGVVLQPAISAQIITELKKTKRFGSSEQRDVLDKLTEREIGVIKLIGVGNSNKEIATALFISEGTVKIHVSNIISKMNFRDRTQVAIYAVKMNLV
jgi:DNA-binding NarL/FixJ family response regulator